MRLGHLIDWLRIQVLAPSNVGKSSFIMTIHSAIKGMREKPTGLEVRVSGGADHTTMSVNNYPLTEKISINDIFGWDFNSDNLQVDRFKCLLEGMLKFGQSKNDPSVSESDLSRASNAVLLMLTFEDCFTPGFLEKLKVLHDSAREMGRVVAFAITKLDTIADDTKIQQFNDSVDPETAQNFLLNSSAFKRCSERIQQVISGQACCYPLVNYQNHQQSTIRKLDYLAGSIVEGILIQLERESMLIDTSSEIFDPFQFETPIKAVKIN
ncbi:GTP-binding protein EngA [Naegleria gruberi]|uniref:GTP-binding protein EngA n=1 Tax=Naegleria gruberi TaxID=5762 RepID=D2VVZ1_NAEGR|nr:GTP-binding protein EngA [Naegleria gruberi]EFC38926.1 GTP-binding protein EngA [Naegleria gruberi]|eukprot:XP_002671670.1 GTP-binding protein EngA [Naegleria gruberi strain NEG-M]